MFCTLLSNLHEILIERAPQKHPCILEEAVKSKFVVGKLVLVGIIEDLRLSVPVHNEWVLFSY